MKRYFHIVRGVGKIDFLKEFISTTENVYHSAVVLKVNDEAKIEEIKNFFNNKVEIINENDIERISDEIINSEKIFVW